MSKRIRVFRVKDLTYLSVVVLVDLVGLESSVELRVGADIDTLRLGQFWCRSNLVGEV